MTSRVLVVDDIPANVRLLESRLQAEYFDVRTAANGRDALDIAERERIDLVLLDVMMPDMTGFEVCAALKSQSSHRARPGHHRHIARSGGRPGEGTGKRRRRLSHEAGQRRRARGAGQEPAPPQDGHRRTGASSDRDAVGRAERGRDHRRTPRFRGAFSSSTTGKIRLGRIRQALQRPFEVVITGDPAEAIALAGSRDFDLIMISLSLKAGDGLRLCTQIKTIDRLRQTPVLLITDASETPMVLRALDLGVNDYIIRPIDVNELRARVRTQLRRKLYQDSLRNMVTQAVEFAITDPLTGLYNRRYLDAHLQVALSRAPSDGEAGLRA